MIMKWISSTFIALVFMLTIFFESDAQRCEHFFLTSRKVTWKKIELHCALGGGVPTSPQHVKGLTEKVSKIHDLSQMNQVVCLKAIWYKMFDTKICCVLTGENQRQLKRLSCKRRFLGACCKPAPFHPKLINPRPIFGLTPETRKCKRFFVTSGKIQWKDIDKQCEKEGGISTAPQRVRFQTKAVRNTFISPFYILIIL